MLVYVILFVWKFVENSVFKWCLILFYSDIFDVMFLVKYGVGEIVI